MSGAYEFYISKYCIGFTCAYIDHRSEKIGTIEDWWRENNTISMTVLGNWVIGTVYNGFF